MVSLKSKNMNQQLAKASAYMPGRCGMCTRQMAALLALAGTILNIWRHIRSWTLSIDVYLLQEHSYRTSSQTNLKRQEP